jgi:hypothetical protein
MVAEPSRRTRRAAEELLAAGATVIAGHSAHVFHGVAPRALLDLGDFLDDYAANPQLRNDLGLLWLTTWIPPGRAGSARCRSRSNSASRDRHLRPRPTGYCNGCSNCAHHSEPRSSAPQTT